MRNSHTLSRCRYLRASFLIVLVLLSFGPVCATAEQDDPPANGKQATSSKKTASPKKTAAAIQPTPMILAGTQKAPGTADGAKQIATVLRHALAGSRLSVDVMPMPVGYAVTYSPTGLGVVVEQKLKEIDPDDRFVLTEAGELMESVWPLVFVHGEVPRPLPTDAGKQFSVVAAGAKDTDTTPSTKATATTTDTATNIAAALNAYYGTDLVMPYSNKLLLQGDPETVQSARRLLAQWIDIPWPQVRLDVWTIQANTKSTRERTKEIAQQKMSEIRAGIALVKDMERALVGSLKAFVQGQKTCVTNGLRVKLFEDGDAVAGGAHGNTGTSVDRGGLLDGIQRADKCRNSDPTDLLDLMKSAGFNPDPMRPLTLADTLVFLAFCDPAPCGNGLNTVLRGEVERAAGRAASTATDGAEDQATREDLNRLVQRIQRVAGCSAGPLPRLRHAFWPGVDWAGAATKKPTGDQCKCIEDTQRSANTAQSTRRGIATFLYYWLKNLDPKQTSADAKLPDLPGLLSTASAGTDAMLKAAMDALHDDINELCTQPLLDWIRDTVQRHNAGDSGIDMVGNVSIAVTSRRPAQTAAQAVGYFPYRGTGDLVKKLSGTSLTSTLFSAAVPAAALNLAQLFEPEELVYNKVAPGVSLGVLPTVLRDGGSARLQINVVTNVDVDQPTSAQYASNGAPVDTVAGHSVETDVAVSALDLFELSTFATEYTRPGEPQWRVPILEMLPLVGRYFQGPAKHEVKHQESLMMINVTILPRSLDLAGLGY